MQKGSAALLLLIAGLLVVGLVIVFYFNPFKGGVLPAPQLSLPTSTPVPQALVYTSQALGFELQYPVKGYFVKDDTEDQFNQRGIGTNNKSAINDFRKNFKGYAGYEPGKFIGAIVVLDEGQQYEVSPISVWVFDNPDQLTIESWFDKFWYYPFVWGVFDYTSKGHIALDSEATISGQPAKSKIVSYQPGKPKFVYVSNNGKMFLFRVIGESGDKILSTFKFTP